MRDIDSATVHDMPGEEIFLITLLRSNVRNRLRVKENYTGPHTRAIGLTLIGNVALPCYGVIDITMVKVEKVDKSIVLTLP